MKLKLKNLKVNKAAGPDEISPMVLSQAADVLALPVAELFRRSLASEQIPEDWKKATLTPTFKKGSRLSPGNYRPVSLTCILCKVMESIVIEKITLISLKTTLYVENSMDLSRVDHASHSCSTSWMLGPRY